MPGREVHLDSCGDPAEDARAFILGLKEGYAGLRAENREVAHTRQGGPETQDISGTARGV